MNENFVLLLDIYGELLSKTQREALDLKYNQDLSLSETAEEMGGISRQSVNEARKNGEKRLLELESALGNARRFRAVSAKLDEAERLLGGINGESAEALKAILNGIREEL